ncbi:MAG TPA: response regulator transcription factor [Anaerolineaceae bacterium]
MTSILIIEDEGELAQVLRSYLESGGYTVATAQRGDSGLSLFHRLRPDLVILDLNLPGLDGMQVAREIRSQANTPLIMATARVDETNRLLGLELGADDYIIKPYSPREVVARVRAVLRRANPNGVPNRRLQSGDLIVDQDAHLVTRGDAVLDLTPTEFNLLAALISQPGRAFTRLQLLDSAQGTAYEGYERSIDAHIKNLRAKIEPDPRRPYYIETVFGVGYRFRKE